MTWLSQILSNRVRAAAMASSLRSIVSAGGVRGRRRRCFLAPAVARAFGDARPLAGATAQIIEFRPPHDAAPHHLDCGDPRRIQREDALHTLAVRNLAQGKARIDAGVLAADAYAFEG